MAKNANLRAADKAQNDVFRGKTILLPCDDPEWSNFTKFFAQNFEFFGLPWGELYEKFHKNPYDPAQVAAKQRELYEDYYVKNKKGIYEFILGGCQDTNECLC